MEKRLFTSESVTEGHPDKICDAVSDAVLDALMEQDPFSRVACETCTNTGFVLVMGEITTKANIDIPAIVRKTVNEIGYDASEKGFDGNTCAVMVSLDKQSADIAMGVDCALESRGETGMSDEQLERETAAVNKVMTMGMNAGDSNGKAFGEGSVTGTSADQFVADIMASDVVSATVVEQVYGEGDDPQNDPLVSERTMTATEESELLTALNNQWASATDEQRGDEAYGRKLVSIAALMNVEVTLSADGVTKVV